MDGSSAQEEFKYSIKFKFLITNNVAEFETLLSRSRLAKKIRANKITIHTDLQLIV